MNIQYKKLNNFYHLLLFYLHRKKFLFNKFKSFWCNAILKLGLTNQPNLYLVSLVIEIINEDSASPNPETQLGFKADEKSALCLIVLNFLTWEFKELIFKDLNLSKQHQYEVTVSPLPDKCFANFLILDNSFGVKGFLDCTRA